MKIFEKLKKIKLEDILCLYVILCPILDMISFLFRNYFDVSFSPSTIIRPIIPALLFIILFFKEDSKLKKVGIGAIYALYSIVHLYLFRMLHNGSSYGNITNELQYIINYSLMIINLYLFKKIIKNNDKIEKSVYISLAIYTISLFVSILTGTSSNTYLEGIGYKGYFESGNSLCTVLILAICILLSNIERKDWKKIILIIFTGIYLCLFAGMRTGLFGFAIVVGCFILGKLLISIRDNVTLNKKQIIIITIGIIIAISVIFVFGSKTLERRSLLKEEQNQNIDEDTGELRFVTGDILNIYKQIQNGTIEENYMSDAEKNAIIDLCEFAEKVKLSNVNLREQQLIYNLFLVKEQKNIGLILFGNGYKNQTGELVMEMEIPALLMNFGIVGFILYFGPFLAIFVQCIYVSFKNIKKIEIKDIMYLVGMVLAIILSTLSGYVYFNFSSMTMVIILNVLSSKGK